MRLSSRLRRRRRRDRGIRSRRPDGRAARRSRCQHCGRSGRQPGGGYSCRSESFRRGAHGAGRSRRPRQRAASFVSGPAVRGSCAARSCDRPGPQGARSTGHRPVRPTPARPGAGTSPAEASAVRNGRQARDLLSESSSPAVRVVAEQPADPQGDHDFPPGDRGVGQTPPVPAVDAARRRRAAGALHLLVHSGRVDPDRGTDSTNSADHQTVQVWKQDRQHTKIRASAISPTVKQPNVSRSGSITKYEPEPPFNRS